MATWSFITNNGVVLALVSHTPKVTVREIALRLGITERAVLRIIADLDRAGYLTRHREGRGNRYEVNKTLPLPELGLGDVVVGDLLKVLKAKPERREHHRDCPG